uniref:LMP2 protein n=1 Tax=Rattus norvegicus TaxID=10116 RepID=Q63566_RAT|nr:LMP2 [Rattus norvegicus]
HPSSAELWFPISSGVRRRQLSACGPPHRRARGVPFYRAFGAQS